MKRALITFVICATVGTAAAEPKREVPDYDGRGDPPTTAGDVLIWIPRVAVAPLYLVAEYVVRRPTGALVETAERHRWVPRIIDYLNGPIGIVPTALIELINDPDPEKSRRVMEAMLQMIKIDIATLRRAYAG